MVTPGHSSKGDSADPAGGGPAAERGARPRSAGGTERRARPTFCAAQQTAPSDRRPATSGDRGAPAAAPIAHQRRSSGSRTPARRPSRSRQASRAPDRAPRTGVPRPDRPTGRRLSFAAERGPATAVANAPGGPRPTSVRDGVPATFRRAPQRRHPAHVRPVQALMAKPAGPRQGARRGGDADPGRGRTIVVSAASAVDTRSGRPGRCDRPRSISRVHRLRLVGVVGTTVVAGRTRGEAESGRGERGGSTLRSLPGTDRVPGTPRGRT